MTTVGIYLTAQIATVLQYNLRAPPTPGLFISTKEAL